MTVFSNPRDLEHMASPSTITYSRPIERNTRVVLDSLDGFYVKVCREYLFGGYFGAKRGMREQDSVTSQSNIYDRPRSMWSDDAEGATLIQGARNSTVYHTGRMVTPGAVTLAKDETDQTHALEFALDDQDDELEIPLNLWPGGRQYGLPAGVTGMIFDIRKKESNASNLLAWCLKSTDSAFANIYWDDGAGAWTATIADAWTDFSGSTTLADESKTFNTQTYFQGDFLTGQSQGLPGPPVSLMIRPSVNAASSTASIYFMSVYDSRVASQGIRVGTDVTSVNQLVLDVPYRCRLGVISDSAVAVSITEIDKR